MAELVWDLVEDRQFEAGLDKGVFYGSDGKGIPWNGLVSIDDASEGFQTDPLFVDGVKVMDLITYGDYTANLTAFTYPDAFLEYEGFQEYGTGVYLDDQPQKTFGLSYRTVVATSDGAVHYKIHLLYELTAIPDDITYQTLTNEVSPIEFKWKLTGLPQAVPNRRPTVHFVFDSAMMNTTSLETVEEILYGTAVTDAYLPSIVDLLEAALTITIVDNGDGTWSATGPDTIITMLDATTFQIAGVNGSFIDADNYTIRTS